MLRAGEVPLERQAAAEYAAHFRHLLSQLPSSAASDMAVLADCGDSLPPRHAAAVRCRLEYKRGVMAGLEVLRAYDAHLTASTVLPAAR
jgi:hypothetical protein